MKNLFDMKCTTKVALATVMAAGIGFAAIAGDTVQTNSISAVNHDPAGAADLVHPKAVRGTGAIDTPTLQKSTLGGGIGIDSLSGPKTIGGGAPPNDNCQDADSATIGIGDSHTFTGNNEGATNQCASFPGGHVWLEITLTEDADLHLEYCGSGPPVWGNAWLNLANGCPCDSFTAPASFAFSCGDGNVQMTWGNWPAGTYYYPVMLDPGNDSIGDYTITVSATGAVDPCEDGVGDCCEAQTGSPTCDDPECCTLICGQDPFCCDVNWDGLCADAANEQCAICDDPPPPGGCTGDVNGDGIVGPADLIALLDCWGPVSDPACEAADLNDDGVVDWFDLLAVLNDWGCFDGDPLCGDPEAGDCCEANGTPNCSDLDCCNAVCAEDPFCCETEWDGLCADLANEICDVCNPEDNDTCAGAIAIECDSKTLGSTLNATFSNAGTCGTSHTAPDVWYTITGTGGPIEVNTCNQASNYDTKLTVWTGSCSALECVGGNDDASCEFGGLLSRVVFNSVEGQTYYIMVHGFSQGIGDFGLNVICLDPPDPFECPDGASDEGEDCGSDTNGGCNADPPVFGSISCGETICGTSWADGNFRDTDWFEIVTDDTNDFTFCGTAEFDFVVGLVDTGGSGNCADASALNPFAVGQPGQEVCVNVTLGPGTYWWFIAPTFFNGMPCGAGGNGYHITLSCEGSEAGCGVPGTGSCCEANGTPYCDDAECCNAVCAGDPFCCDTEWDSLCAEDAQEVCAVCVACGHPEAGNCCVANGTPYCDDEACCEAICAFDPFCCDVNWDGLCADAANAQCEVCTGAVCGDGTCDPSEDCDSCPEDCGDCPAVCGDGAGDCCAEGGNGTPGCDDVDCCETVCSCDPFCCDTEWDGFCADEGFGGTGCGAALLCDICQ